MMFKSMPLFTKIMFVTYDLLLNKSKFISKM